MTLLEALDSNQYFKRPHWTESFRYYPAGTGPHTDLVSCDYFIIQDDGLLDFSTSIDLYADDLKATDYVFSD